MIELDKRIEIIGEENGSEPRSTTLPKSEEEKQDEYPLEYYLFAAALREEGAIEHMAKYLSPNDVGALHGNRGLHEIYSALVSFYDKTGVDPIDPIVFKSWVETETEIYDALGGTAGVSVLFSVLEGLDPTDLHSTISVIKERARKRRQLDALQELQILINSKKEKSEKDLEKISKLTEEIRSLENKLDYNPLDKVDTGMDVSAELEHLMEIPSFLPTQYTSLNRAMGYNDNGGFFRGAVHSVIAPSGKGKSTLVKCLANHWLDEGHAVLYVNFEEPKSHWTKILMTQVIEENVYKSMDSWTADERHKKLGRFRKKIHEWGERFMVLHDPDSLYFDDLELWLRDILANGKNVPDVVIIDTLQSMFSKVSTGGGARWNQYEQMMVRLERLAKEMDAVFIITGQQNTNAAKEKRDVLEMQDVGGGITIVQKSTVVMVLVERKLTADDDSISNTIMELQLIKNRITGTEFSNKPPVLEYIDEYKTYVEYKMPDQKEYDASTQALAAQVLGDEFKGLTSW